MKKKHHTVLRMIAFLSLSILHCLMTAFKKPKHVGIYSKLLQT